MGANDIDVATASRFMSIHGSGSWVTMVPSISIFPSLQGIQKDHGIGSEMAMVPLISTSIQSGSINASNAMVFADCIAE